MTAAFAELSKCMARIGVQNTIGLLRIHSVPKPEVTKHVLAELRKAIAATFGIHHTLLDSSSDVRTDDIKYAKATYYHILHHTYSMSYAKMKPVVCRGNDSIKAGLGNAAYIMALPADKLNTKTRKHQQAMCQCVKHAETLVKQKAPQPPKGA